jgi:PPM family protein phosphatase
MSRLVLSDYPTQFVARSFALSCKGAHEPLNQDSYLAVDHFPPTLHHPFVDRDPSQSVQALSDSLFVVADGRGEEQAGCRASVLAIEVIEEFLRYIWGHFRRRKQVAGKRHILNALRVAFDRADQFIWNEAEEERSSLRMGAEVTAACTYRGHLFLAHAGNSQAFLWRAGKLHRLTRPSLHEPDRLQLDSGDACCEQPATEDRKTPLLGGRRAGVHVLLRMLDLEPNDYLLLCTKGLTEHVGDHVINSTLSAIPDPQRVCETLLKEAENHSRHEDLTAIVARFALAHE